MSGLTITFISNKQNDPTSINHRKFGNKCWDDSSHNNSKMGYYFIYYYKKQYGFVHKIINITKSTERPSYMEWESDRNILYLSEVLKKFTWNEWINSIGKGAPYSKDYRICCTISWTGYELKRFVDFDYNFIKIVEPVSMTSSDLSFVEDEEILFERKRLLKQQKLDEENRQELIKIREKKINIQSLRDEKIKSIYNKNTEIQKQIDLLISEQDKHNRNIYHILKGERDEELIDEKKKNENIV